MAIPLFTGGGAPPPPRTDADASARSHMSSPRHGRRRKLFTIALGSQRLYLAAPSAHDAVGPDHRAHLNRGLDGARGHALAAAVGNNQDVARRERDILLFSLHHFLKVDVDFCARLLPFDAAQDPDPVRGGGPE